MWMDDSNRGGGEPPHGHGPVIRVVETAFANVDLHLFGSRPTFEGEDTPCRFVIDQCEHGAILVNIDKCAVLPLPKYVGTWERLHLALAYLFGRIVAPAHQENCRGA